MGSHNTVVIDGELSLFIEGGTPEFGMFTEVHDYVYPVYTGDTVVIPRAFESQVLPTQNKTVTDDITVTEIPYTEVSNLAGGLTVSIG